MFLLWLPLKAPSCVQAVSVSFSSDVWREAGQGPDTTFVFTLLFFCFLSKVPSVSVWKRKFSLFHWSGWMEKFISTKWIADKTWDNIISYKLNLDSFCISTELKKNQSNLLPHTHAHTAAGPASTCLLDVDMECRWWKFLHCAPDTNITQMSWCCSKTTITTYGNCCRMNLLAFSIARGW